MRESTVIAELNAQRAEDYARISSRILHHYVDLFPGFTFTELDAALSVMAEEIKTLRAAVRNKAGDDLCWIAGMPEMAKALPREEFLQSCVRYHSQIAEARGVFTGGRTIAQLEKRIIELEEAPANARRTRILHQRLERWFSLDSEVRFMEVMPGETYRWCVRLKQYFADEPCERAFGVGESGAYLEALAKALDCAFLLESEDDRKADADIR